MGDLVLIVPEVNDTKVVGIKVFFLMCHCYVDLIQVCECVALRHAFVFTIYAKKQPKTEKARKNSKK